jgi:hypothetical protein
MFRSKGSAGPDCCHEALLRTAVLTIHRCTTRCFHAFCKVFDRGTLPWTCFIPVRQTR